MRTKDVSFLRLFLLRHCFDISIAKGLGLDKIAEFLRFVSNFGYHEFLSWLSSQLNSL